MFARMAMFEVDDPGLIDGEIETTRRYVEGGRLPEGIRAVCFLMMVDRARGRSSRSSSSRPSKTFGREMRR